MTKIAIFRMYHHLNLLLVTFIVILVGCAQQPAMVSTGADIASGGPPPILDVVVDPLGQAAELQPDHPQTYTVAAGDTLWSIAGRFLSSPWRWREVWRQNPDIQNPNLIYVGDVIELYYEADQPRLRLAATGERPTIKLSPQVRVQALDQPIPTISRETISSFLNESRVLSQSEWAGSAYILGAVDDRVLFATGERIFARGGEFDMQFYQAFRPGEEYHDPVTNESLGFDVIFLGEAVLEDDNDPATLRLTKVKRGIQPGDRLFPVEGDEDFVLQFLPHPVDEDMSGQIIAALSGSFLVGRTDSVVVNLGEVDGMEPGHVMATYKPGEVITDPQTGETIQLPDEKSGLLMIYRVFDRVSYGLIMEANLTIRVLDPVGAP